MRLNHIGDHLRKRRMDLGLFQKQVAETLGVTSSTIWLWEKGKAYPSVKYMPRIIRFLGYCPLPKPQSIADRLRVARSSVGMSQREFDRLLGVDPSSIQNWEAGTRQPLRWIAKAVEPVLDKLESDLWSAKSLTRRWRLQSLGSITEAATRLSESLPDHLRQARRRIGLTQRELAGRLAISASTVRAWEAGRRRPGRRLALALAQIICSRGT